MFIHKVVFLAVVGRNQLQVWARVPADACDAICLTVPECAADPQSHNSYCKSDHDPQVCFGLYSSSTSSSGYCFFPNDPTCTESNPVLCPTTQSTTVTTTTLVT